MLQNTYTTDSLVERLGLMRRYYNKRLFTEGKDVTLKEVIQDECDEHTLASLQKWIEAFEKDTIQPLVVFEALDTVQEDLGGVPSVTLYVPIRFSPEQIERFGMWFRENVQPNILLSLHIDPRATGGCSFIWNNIFYDFSLKYFIEKQKEDIVATFDKYTHVK